MRAQAGAGNQGLRAPVGLQCHYRRGTQPHGAAAAALSALHTEGPASGPQMERVGKRARETPESAVTLLAVGSSVAPSGLSAALAPSWPQVPVVPQVIEFLPWRF